MNVQSTLKYYYILSLSRFAATLQILKVSLCSKLNQVLPNTPIQELSSSQLQSCLLLTVAIIATMATQPIPSTELLLHMIPPTGSHRHTTSKIRLNTSKCKPPIPITMAITATQPILSTGLHRHTINKLRLHTSKPQPPIPIMVRTPSSMTVLSQLSKSYAALFSGTFS